MKLNKTFTLAALVAASLLAGGLAAQAQDSTTNTPSATPSIPAAKPRAGGAAMMLKQLDLTDDQKPKVKAALDDQMQQMRDLRADASIAPQDKRAKMKEIRDATNAKLKDILTPDQYAKWMKLSSHRRPMPAPATPATNAPAI